jgi:Asp-tRNA(Asn)/Glu-tRNA(Gln) amidotransferase A subunit family amidase
MRSVLWNTRVPIKPLVNIVWNIDPEKPITNPQVREAMLTFKVVVRADMGDLHAQAEISMLEIPLSKETKEYVENSLKRELVQLFLSTLDCTSTIGPKN